MVQLTEERVQNEATVAEYKQVKYAYDKPKVLTYGVCYYYSWRIAWMKATKNK